MALSQPCLQAVATALPPHILDGGAVQEYARGLFGPALDALGPVHLNSGIDRRHSCVPLDWYGRPHGWKERNALFARHGADLAELAARRCLDKAGLGAGEIDVVITVSTTGIMVPSLDAVLMGRLGLRSDIARLPLFGLGCAGGALGLARAAAMAQGNARVLLVVVELCGLTFRAQDHSAANMVATALFGDGAAAALIGPGPGPNDGPRLAAWGEHTWPDTREVMGWRIEDDGFGVLFSRDIPTIIARHLRPALQAWLERHGLGLSEIGRFLCHPGGAKVITALEHALALAEGSLRVEREILRRHGNMSAASLLFVLERAWPLPGRSVAMALGPGFTAGFVALEWE